MTRRSTQFAVGILLGFVASSVIAIALVAAVAAVVSIVVVALVRPRFAALAGGALIGVGGTWLVLTLNSVRICAATQDFCGDANFTGFIAITAGLVVTGALLALWSAVAANRQVREP